jgi:Holliday junction resolvase
MDVFWRSNRTSLRGDDTILLCGSIRGVVEFSVLFRGAPYCGVKIPDSGGVSRLRVFFTLLASLPDDWIEPRR